MAALTTLTVRAITPDEHLAVRATGQAVWEGTPEDQKAELPEP